METLTAPRNRRVWQRPTIAFEMPFRATQFGNGRAAMGANPATTNTFTPVVKLGAAAEDLIFVTCVSAS